jgi:hypothetical protein
MRTNYANFLNNFIGVTKLNSYLFKGFTKLLLQPLNSFQKPQVPILKGFQKPLERTIFCRLLHKAPSGFRKPSYVGTNGFW